MAFRGQTVVVIGGSSGMGRAIAGACQARGARVVVVGRNPQRLESVRSEFGSGIETVQADAADREAMERLFAGLGGLDHLVVTAADLTFKPFLELEAHDIQRMIDSKLWGPINACQKAARHLNRGGSITLFSGLAAYKPAPGASIIAALNAGLEGLAKTLALELAPIRVNVISPGIVDTPVWSGMGDSERAKLYDSVAKTLPVGRVGSPEDLAQAALFLMTSHFVTGTVIHADGGGRLV